MRELNQEEIAAVSGGYLPHLGAVAVAYKTACETATWYGADRLGAWIGNSIYDMLYGTGDS